VYRRRPDESVATFVLRLWTGIDDDAATAEDAATTARGHRLSRR
jgi:hypothetical protein